MPAVCSARTRSMSPNTTRAPAAASAVASARPIPDPAPVTTATLSSMSISFLERAKSLGALTFGMVWPQHRCCMRSGQNSARHCVDFVEGNAVYLGQRVADAAILAVIELAAADPIH